MKSSNEVLAEIEDLRAQAKTCANDGDVDGANYNSGKADLLQSMLPGIFEDEKSEAQRKYDQGRLSPITGGNAEPAKKSMAELLLGPRDDFKGIDPEQARMGISVIVDDALDLPTPEVVQFDLPTTTVPTGGYLSTIGRGTTEGNITFPRPAPSTNRLVLPTWEKGLKKPPQVLAWEQAHAYVEWFAATFPVELVALQDYGQLESVIGTELRNGYERACRFYSVQGNNPHGIIGILDEQAGVPTFDKSNYEGANLVDLIEIMATREYLRTGIMPNTVCMGPLLREQLRLLKKQDGSNEYLTITLENRIWGLDIVEDENFQDFKEDGSDPTDEWLMVYDRTAAQWNVQHGMTLSAMPVGDQFLRNQTTFRLEGSNMHQILDPMRFLKMKLPISEHDGALARFIAPMPAPRGIGVKGYGVEFGKNVSEFGHFAVDGTDLVGEADFVSDYTGYSKTKDNQSGYFVALHVPEGSKCQKDSDPEKQDDGSGIAVIRLGKSSIEAKKFKVTAPDGTVTTLNIKVTANPGPSKRQGPRVSA